MPWMARRQGGDFFLAVAAFGYGVWLVPKATLLASTTPDGQGGQASG